MPRPAALLLALATFLAALRTAAAQPPGLYVPDTPGAEEAQAWLAQHHREQSRQRHRESCMAWPKRPVALPSCNASLVAQQRQRRHLVLATVGDGWGPEASRNKWLDDPALAAAGFDLVAIYYGSNATWNCTQCLHIFRDAGTKWQMIHAAVFSPEWARLIADKDYGYVWMPDDDIVTPTCTIAQFFAVLEEQQLFLAQMSVCREQGSGVLWPHLFQRPDNALRYVAFVEIMAAAVRFDFFQAVIRPSIAHSFTGWGLDTIWPFLLGYPHDGVAVVDAVCMVHAGNAGQGKKPVEASNYAAAAKSPYHNPWHEDESVKASWHVSGAAIAALGVPTDIGGRGTREFHSVPLLKQPAAGTPAAEASPGAANTSSNASAPAAASSTGELQRTKALNEVMPDSKAVAEAKASRSQNASQPAAAPASRAAAAPAVAAANTAAANSTAANVTAPVMLKAAAVAGRQAVGNVSAAAANLGGTLRSAVAAASSASPLPRSASTSPALLGALIVLGGSLVALSVRGQLRRRGRAPPVHAPRGQHHPGNGKLISLV